MFKKVTVNYCGDIAVTEYFGSVVKEKELLIEIKYVYMSIADEALNQCNIIAKDYRRTLGSIAVGKVVRSGIGVQDIFEGSRVLVFPIANNAPIEFDGACQSIYNIGAEYVIASSQKAFNDLEMLFIATLSIHRKILNNIKGLSTLIVGNDISILPFAYYSMLYSPKFAIIPQYTLWPDILKSEHVSPYNSNRKFDVVVLASSDPLINNIVLKSYQDATIIIIHPSVLPMIKLSNMLSSYSEKHVIVMKFGDIGTGIEIFNAFKENLTKRINLIKVDYIPKNIKTPLIIQVASS
uniref:Uncharacterized protein n=2 Tax=Ignisphaera aggregans TaxID=334771 RepID=A0A7C5Z0G1_9CREN